MEGGSNPIREPPYQLLFFPPPIQEVFRQTPNEGRAGSFSKICSRYAEAQNGPRPSKDPLASDVLFVLQLCAGNEPLLPGPRTFECEAVSEEFMPFVPLILSPRAVEIGINLFVASPPTVMVASRITHDDALQRSEICIRNRNSPPTIDGREGGGFRCSRVKADGRWEDEIDKRQWKGK